MSGETKPLLMSFNFPSTILTNKISLVNHIRHPLHMHIIHGLKLRMMCPWCNSSMV